MNTKIFALVSVLLFMSCSQTKGLLEQVSSGMESNNITNQEVVGGLKQALEQGTMKGSSNLSQENGYFRNGLVKILFPPEAQKVESTLRKIGLNKLCDNFVLSLNRAAEKAALKAQPIFVGAIKQMSIQDAMSILMGSKHEATDYFKEKTSSNLMTAFKPVIQQSLDQVDATKYWKDMMYQYNRIPFVEPVEADLSKYVGNRAISGLFLMISREEEDIRKNLTSRTTSLMQKVFGYADRNRKKG